MAKPDRPEDIPAKVMETLLDSAADYMSGFGIDFEQFVGPEVIFDDDMVTCRIEWTHMETHNKVVLSNVWWHEGTGEIMQAGNNYGNLTL